MAGRATHLGPRTEFTLRRLLREQGYDMLAQRQDAQLITVTYAGYAPHDPIEHLEATSLSGHWGIKAQIAALPKREVR